MPIVDPITCLFKDAPSFLRRQASRSISIPHLQSWPKLRFYYVACPSHVRPARLSHGCNRTNLSLSPKSEEFTAYGAVELNQAEGTKTKWFSNVIGPFYAYTTGIL